MLTLSKYSIGVGDRFAHQATAQLRACMMAADAGVEVIPVWNKSHREHTIVGSEPPSARAAAEQAVRELGWNRPWHVDADHIRLATVDGFLDSSDFFTIDVADSIGKPADGASVESFVQSHPELVGSLEVPGIEQPLDITISDVERIASRYLLAVREAGEIYRYVAGKRPADSFITEVSMDETDSPQTPPELLVILRMLADEEVPLQTIAPKFTGRFNKGVDYVGDVAQFEREFNDDLAVIAWAVSAFGLPSNLKLSVHSGSDKFSIYGPIRKAVRRFDAGVHVKTAGTTWLEELIGLAEAAGPGLALAKEVYVQALHKQDALCAPYASVIDIRSSQLPTEGEVNGWSSEQFVSALRHDQSNPAYNASLRQLLHVGYKVAAQMGDRYLGLLRECEPTIARNVTMNLYDRHIKPLFVS